MLVGDIGWVRPVLFAILAVLGAALWWGSEEQRLGRVADAASAQLRQVLARRTGGLLLGWAVWVLLQMVAGLPLSWAGVLVAPLILVIAALASTPAMLQRRRRRARTGSESPIPARGGWLVLALRELIPLGIYLTPILLIRRHLPALPPEIPLGWDVLRWEIIWTPRDAALDVLRHQTMVVYLFLLLAEGGYVLFSRRPQARRDPAVVLLTPRHWLYFLFRTAWVLLFAGINLGLVRYALDGPSALAYALPGLGGLVCFLVAVRIREQRREAVGSPAGS